MMKNLKLLVTYGAILFCSGVVLTILTWPYALSVVEVDTAYAVTSGIVFIAIFTGQLMSIVATSMFSRCIEEDNKPTENTLKTKHYYPENTSHNRNNTSTKSESIFQSYKCFFVFLIVVFYLVIWFSCGAGQLVIVVLMIINVDANDDGGVKAYGAVIIALTIVYMIASFVYSTVVFIWFYHKC